MTRFPSPASRPACVLPVLISLLFVASPASLMAQGWATANGWSGGALCGSTDRQPTAASFDCRNLGAEASGFAFAKEGMIGGDLFVSAIGSRTPPIGIVSASWQDILRVSTPGPPPAKARFRVVFTGNLRAVARVWSVFFSSARFAFGSTGKTWGAIASGGGTQNIVTERTDFWTIADVSLVPMGLESVAPIWLSFVSEAGSRGPYTGGPVDGMVRNTHSSTGKIVGLEFLDEAGRPFKGTVSYSFDHGTRIYTTTTPEPASIWLLATAFVLVAGVSRLRRGRR